MRPTTRTVATMTALTAGMLAAITTVGSARTAAQASKPSVTTAHPSTTRHDIAATWEAPATISVGHQVDAELSLAATTSLHDLSLRLTSAGGLTQIRPGRIAPTLGTSHIQVPVRFET